MTQKNLAVRAPVGIVEVSTAKTEGRYEIVVCDDGAVFRGSGGRWHEETPIPGTRRAVDMTIEDKF